MTSNGFLVLLDVMVCKRVQGKTRGRNHGMAAGLGTTRGLAPRFNLEVRHALQ